MLIDNLSRIPDSLKDGVRGILLLHRSKEGNDGNPQRKSLKKISMNKEEWHEIIEEFRHLRMNSIQYKDHRIYASINPRNIEKSIHDFKLRCIEMDYGCIKERGSIEDIENRFFSCLMNPSSRAESNFLIECDTLLQTMNARILIPTHFILFEYETKNGSHMITIPFNPHNYIGIEIKKDDLMYIG